MKKEIIIAQSNEHLKTLIEEEIRLHGNNCDLNHINVGNITDISLLFSNSNFNGDISHWDVSKVTNMSFLFYCSRFDGDISKWDVSNVTTMENIFFHSSFNGDISKWNVYHVTTMNFMFCKSIFNRDISSWDVSNVTHMLKMFYESKFTEDINKWKPYMLAESNQLSDNSDFKIPCWGNLKSNQAIQEAIAREIVMKQKEELEKELSTITSHTTKHKVKL